MRFPPKVSPVFKQQFSNPLDKFKSYKWYHIWVLAKDMTGAIELFQDTRNIDVIHQLRDRPDSKDAGIRTPMTINGHKYVVLVNGAKDADLVIDRYETTGVAQAPQQTQAANTVVSQEIIIDLHEPMGVKFPNIYRQALIDLGERNENAVSVLKTVFVGITYDDKVESYYDVPPTFMMVYDMEVTIDERGSSYTIFLLHNAAIPFHPKLAKQGSGVTITRRSIGEALNQIAQYYSDNSERSARLVGGRDIKYRIILSDDMQSVAGWPLNTSPDRQLSGNGLGPFVIPPELPIEVAIERVFMSSLEYLEQAVAQTPQSFIYKVVSSLYKDTNGEMTVVYQIIKYKSQRRNEITQRAATSTARTREEFENTVFTEDDPVLIYDYIFTGKNTDIEKFDMVIKEGLAFFQAVTNIDTSAGNYAQGNTVVVSCSTDPTANANTPGQIYCTPGAATNIQLSSNDKRAIRKAQYDKLLFDALSLEAAKMGAALRVRGNPGYLSCFAIDPRTIFQPGISPIRGMYSASEMYTTKIPYVHINVRMPKSWTGSTNYTETPTEMESFWYQGVWEVITIRTIMDQSGFVVELDMLASAYNKAAQPTTTEQQTSGDAAHASQPEPAGSPRPLVPPEPPATQLFTRPPSGMTEDTQITRCFKYGDMLRSSTATRAGIGNFPPDKQTEDNIVFTLQQLQRIVDALGIPCGGVRITSGYRNNQVNALVGGVQNSDHTRGLGVDFVLPSFAGGNVDAAVRKIATLGIPFRQLIAERPRSRTSSWIHIGFSRTATGPGQLLSWDGGTYRKLS